MNDRTEKSSQPPVKVMLSGANGFMGQAVIRLSETMPGVEIIARFNGAGGFQDQPLGDVVLDVSHFSRTPAVVEFARMHQLPLVIGTTALKDEAKEAIAKAARSIAICQASNFSLGALVLARVARLAARHLAHFEVSIEETHHVHKKDAPSGTALMLQSAIQETLGHSAPIASIRHGEVIGTHEINLVGEGETLSLVHKVTDRDVFARGALATAKLMIGQSPGLYELSELFGLDKA